MIPDYESLAYRVTPPQGRLTGVKLGQDIHREHNFHGLFKVIDRLLTFSHILYWKIFGGHVETLL